MTTSDCCSATARVEVMNLGTAETLTFCAHHYRQHADALMEEGFTYISEDTREALRDRPTLHV